MTAVTRYFEHLLAEHGDSPRALDWSAEGQRERFRVLCEVGITAGSSVLDVGCGLGHFFDWLRESKPGFIGEYAGVDFSAEMISRAKERANGGAVFMKADAVREPPVDCCYDYVVASGVLNVEQGDNASAMRRLIRNCYDTARVAVAINMLSARAPNKRTDRHYYEPGKMLAACLELTPRVTLRHDYKDNDFTVYLFKV